MDVHSLEIEAIFLAMIVSIIFLSSLALHHWRLLGSNQQRMIKGTYNKSVFPTYRHCLISKHIKQQKLDGKLETGLLYSFVHMILQLCTSTVLYLVTLICSCPCFRVIVTRLSHASGICKQDLCMYVFLHMQLHCKNNLVKMTMSEG